MKAEIKIPNGYNPESLILSMQTLKLDPNFRALSDMVKENDIAMMREDLINGEVQGVKLTNDQTDSLRYRLGVFKEFLEMPDTIIESMQTERKAKKADAEDERSDPYSTEEDINKSRGG